jgi:hypothetical protein
MKIRSVGRTGMSILRSLSLILPHNKENNNMGILPADNTLKPVIYVAGRYSDGGTLSEQKRWRNRNIMRYFSIKFMKKGWAVLCPIENDEWAYEDGVITYEDTLSSDLAVIKKCDAIFFCPGWEKGKGTLVEHQFAKDNDIPILYDVIISTEL